LYHATKVAIIFRLGASTAYTYNTLQQQSLLLALKEILGYLLVISVVIAVISRFIPFHKTIRVTFKKTGDDMV